MSKSQNTLNKLMLLGIICSTLFYVGFPLLDVSGVLTSLGIKKASFESLLLSRAIQWAFLLVLIGYAVAVEKQGLLLWKNHKYKIPMLLLHAVLLYIAALILVVLANSCIKMCGVHQESKSIRVLVGLLRHYPIMITVTCITAGIVEEYVFRGYLQPRIEAIFKSPVAGILITSILFAAGHYAYGTVINVMGPLVIGLLFSVYYWKYRNIYPLIICHFLIDFISISAMVYNPHFK